MPEIERSGANPLQKYFRQPKIYIKLPSNGKWYPNGSLEVTDNMEFPVYAMTAKDELSMKTPDALLNGQATVDMIKSCVPSIVNPWHMPSIDLDTVLVAIRIATYGDTLEIDTKVPGTGEERKFDVDLRKLLNKMVTVDYLDVLNVENMKVELRPLTYKEFTDASLKTFEEQRIASAVQDNDMTDDEKLVVFNKAFTALTSITIDMVMDGVATIQTAEGDVVTDKNHIAQFISNADKKFYTSVTDNMEANRSKFSLKPITIESTEEELEAGAPKTWEMPITFDQANFFG